MGVTRKPSQRAAPSSEEVAPPSSTRQVRLVEDEDARSNRCARLDRWGLPRVASTGITPCQPCGVHVRSRWRAPPVAELRPVPPAGVGQGGELWPLHHALPARELIRPQRPQQYPLEPEPQARQAPGSAKTPRRVNCTRRHPGPHAPTARRQLPGTAPREPSLVSPSHRRGETPGRRVGKMEQRTALGRQRPLRRASAISMTSPSPQATLHAGGATQPQRRSSPATATPSPAATTNALRRPETARGHNAKAS